MSPSPGAAPGSPTPNYKTCVILANYEPISTKFSGISVPTSWQGMDEKYVEKCHPLFRLPHPHIFKYCQLLDITDNNERISMKFSGISLLARRRKWVKKYQNVSPFLGLPQQPQPSILKHALSRPITNRFLLLQHIYCLTQCIGCHCDTADIVIHSTVYIILAITWSSPDPTVAKKFQLQADREGRRNGGRDKVEICHPLGRGSQPALPPLP